MSISLGQTVLTVVMSSFILFSSSYIKLVDAVHLTIMSCFFLLNILSPLVLYTFKLNTQITEQSVFLKDIILESTIKHSNLIQEMGDAHKSNAPDKKAKAERAERLDSAIRHLRDIVSLMEATDSLRLLKLFVFPINTLILRFLAVFGALFYSLVSIKLIPVVSGGIKDGFIDFNNLWKHVPK